MSVEKGYQSVLSFLESIDKFFSNKLLLFLIILITRVINALTTKTFFQPDEFYQALEPAYYKVWGNGYLTWEWKYGLRSFMHPLLYTFVYQLINKYQLSHWFVINLPKVFNAVICAIGEFYFFRLSYKLSKEAVVAKLCLLLSLFNAFNWFCYTRSFANCLELNLTIVALFYFPFIEIYSFSRFCLSLLLAGITCLIRPTSIIIWVYFGLILFFKTCEKIKMIALTVLMGSIALMVDCLVNKSFYGGWEFPILKFIDFNFTKSLSSFYGVSRLDFYFVQAIPILLTTYLPFFIIGLYTTGSKHMKIKIIILGYCLVFTLIEHKEFRFIYPLMPFLLLLTAFGVISASRYLSPLLLSIIALSIIAINAIMSFYLTVHHESGVIQITQTLRNYVLTTNHKSTPQQPVEIGFLTPCHSTPYQSYFDLSPKQANIWFLSCEPPLHLNSSDELSDYKDESDEFYNDPIQFLNDNFIEKSGKYKRNWPDYVVVFEQIYPVLNGYLVEEGYVEIERLFNSIVHWDERRTGDLIIYFKDHGNKKEDEKQF